MNVPVNRSAVFEVGSHRGLPANVSTGCSRASHHRLGVKNERRI